LDLDIIDESVYGIFQDFRVDRSSALTKTNWDNSIGLDRDEYLVFLEKLDEKLLEYIDQMNTGIFGEGIPIPYNMMKLDAWAFFEDRHFIMLFDIIYKP